MVQSKKQKIITYTVFGIYLLFLTWLILLKLHFNIKDIPCFRSINLIPFHYDEYAGSLLQIREVLYNVLVFIPFGVYVCMIKPKWRIPVKMLAALCISFLFELLQYVLAIGASDITDLIGNTLGGILGIIFFYLMEKLFIKKYRDIINGIGLLGELLAAVIISITFAF